MINQLLCIQRSCFSAQSWGSVLPSIVKTRDQHSWGCPLLFSNRIWVLFVHRGQKFYTPTVFGKLWTTLAVKPIFHCDAKYLASGVGVGQCPRHQNFALEIPTCWCILALPNTKICVSPDAKLKICVSPDANPLCQSVEYSWRSVFWRWPCIFHVYSMYISCCLCIIFRVANAKISQRKVSFQWKMDLRCMKHASS